MKKLRKLNPKKPRPRFSVSPIELAIGKLSLAPGDVLVVRLPRAPLDGELKLVKESLVKKLPDGVDVIVASPGVEFTVLRSGKSAGAAAL